MLVCIYDLEDYFVKHKRKCLEYFSGIFIVCDLFVPNCVG